MKTLVALLAVAAPALAADTFTPPCELPFAAIAKPQSIDQTCGISGLSTAKPALIAQDTVKNNFCAKGEPVVLTFDVYPALQAAGEKALGGPHYVPPLDRTPLQKLFPLNGQTIGEGTVVTLAGYVEKAHYSDVSEGEGVNCNLKHDADNDIHIPIVATSGANECTSVTAEISPHARPEAWTPSNLDKPSVPLRFTGQLFFDAEHRPCNAEGKASGAKRVSVWEIHPVYGVDVCTAAEASQCDAGNDKVWTPLHTWVAAQTK